MATLVLYQPAAIGLILIATLIVLVWRIERKPTSRVPGPWYTKYVGWVTTYYWLKGKRAFYVHNLHQKYGPVVRVAPDEVHVTTIDAVKEIYNVKETFLKTNFYYYFAGGRFGPSLFNTHILELHRRYRRLLSGPISESSLKSFSDKIHSRIDLAIYQIGNEMKTQGAANVLKWFLFMATDVIGELTFGSSFQMLEQGKPNHYTEQLGSIAVTGAILATFPSLPPKISNFFIPAIRHANAAFQSMQGYAQESLERYDRQLEADPTSVQQTLFTKVFRASEEGTMSFKEISSNARGYIIAGSDTTAHTLTYLIWSVCRNPEIKSKLLEELRMLPSNFGDRDLKDLPYLRAVVDEALRLYGAAPSALPRAVPKDGRYIAGYWLDEGTTVCTQAYTLHRNPVVFPNPEVFDPSRWFTATKAMKDHFMPFGGGSRVCIGLHLARLEMNYAVAKFFLAYPEAKVSTKNGMCDADMDLLVYFLTMPAGDRCMIQAS